jgi:hypothetical protein
LVAARRRLASSRAAFAARLGLVGFRFLGSTSAAATTSRSRSVTFSRFLNWLLVPLETSRKRPLLSSLGANFCSSRSRWSAVRAVEPATSHQTSIRVEDVLTCWPPGPPEREA